MNEPKTNRVKFTVYGTPQGKARPRFTKSGHTYTPKQTADYESQIRAAYTAASGGKAVAEDNSESVRVSIYAYFAKARTSRTTEPTIKPDIDNIVKIVLDGLNGTAYKDDKQVTTLISAKRYEKLKDSPPRVVVTVEGVKI